MMTDDEYQAAVTQLRFLGALAQSIDTAGILERIQDSDAITPLIDPAMWSAAHPRLDAMADLARAAKQVRDAMDAFDKAIVETQSTVDQFKSMRRMV